jgi:hypothetical protein
MPNIGLVQRCIGANRRHICFVTETYPPEINGVALTLARLLQGLATGGHLVSMIRPYQRDFDCIATDSSVTLVRGLPLPGYNGLQFGLPAGGVLKRLWTKQPPDVVYVATEGPLGWSAVRTARRLFILLPLSIWMLAPPGVSLSAISSQWHPRNDSAKSRAA